MQRNNKNWALGRDFRPQARFRQGKHRFFQFKLYFNVSKTLRRFLFPLTLQESRAGAGAGGERTGKKSKKSERRRIRTSWNITTEQRSKGEGG